MVELSRYGLEWTGPRDFIPKEMPDGFWTPWHVAQAEIERLEAELAETRDNG